MYRLPAAVCSPRTEYRRHNAALILLAVDLRMDSTTHTFQKSTTPGDHHAFMTLACRESLDYAFRWQLALSVRILLLDRTDFELPVSSVSFN